MLLVSDYSVPVSVHTGGKQPFRRYKRRSPQHDAGAETALGWFAAEIQLRGTGTKDVATSSTSTAAGTGRRTAAVATNFT